MRLIDADALKRKSQEVATEAWKLGIKATVEVILNQFIDYIDAAPTIKPEPQWIPCSERLPEDVEIGEEYPTVIFCTKDAVYVGFYEYYRGGRWWAEEDYTVDNVIAWMPLPEPYRKEK